MEKPFGFGEAKKSQEDVLNFIKAEKDLTLEGSLVSRAKYDSSLWKYWNYKNMSIVFSQA